MLKVTGVDNPLDRVLLHAGWNMNAEDAAAFAAAQQMQAAEAARDQRAAGAGGQNNFHQD